MTYDNPDAQAPARDNWAEMWTRPHGDAPPIIPHAEALIRCTECGDTYSIRHLIDAHPSNHLYWDGEIYTVNRWHQLAGLPIGDASCPNCGKPTPHVGGGIKQ